MSSAERAPRHPKSRTELREERLAAALRDNLRKRKARDRALDEAEGAAQQAPEDGAGTGS